MAKRNYSQPSFARYRPVRDVTLLTQCCPFDEEPVDPKRGHAVFSG